jgi:hypothetical protein
MHLCRQRLVQKCKKALTHAQTGILAVRGCDSAFVSGLPARALRVEVQCELKLGRA